MKFSFQKASFLRVFAEIIFMLQVLYLACFLSFDWMSGAFWRDALGHAEQIAPETLFRWWVPFLLLLAINAVFCSFCLKKRLWSFGKKITFSVVSVAASLFQIYAVVATILSYCANKALLLPLILYISVGCGDLCFRAVWLVAWIALEKQIKAERKGTDGIASVCLMSEAAFAIWFFAVGIGAKHEPGRLIAGRGIFDRGRCFLQKSSASNLAIVPYCNMSALLTKANVVCRHRDSTLHLLCCRGAVSGD